jgi:SAM-dependent methyltransferase
MERQIGKTTPASRYDGRRAVSRNPRHPTGTRLNPTAACLRTCSQLLHLGVAQSPLTSPDVWNELHRAYDETLVPLFSIAAKRGIELVAPSSDDEVLDVACGPGTLTLEVAPLVRRVVAVDFAVSMIELLNGKCCRAGVENVETQVGDGTALPFADGRFDAAFSCFGLFLFADRAAGLSELRRVVKPGSKVMISSWAPAEGPIEATYRIVREVLPDLPFGEGHAPLGTKGEIVDEMGGAGFVDVQVERIPIRFAFPSAEAFWRANGLASAPLVATRRRVAPAEWPTIEQRILETLRSSFPARVDFERFAWVAVGKKPQA